ncbi:MAG TPA: ABC transporter substrate-binding protein [Solirubrobacterales bacterium]|jgi:branched-chain amino acid transport system substrate-binding protein|nr:ABC transporter substrate-binding protein [Solirubrobacterales bacterium]
MAHRLSAKWLRSLVLALAIATGALAVTACGSSSSSGGSSSGGSSSASGGETVKIGVIVPLTGGYAETGKASLQGAEAGVNYLNEGGAESGDTYELVTKDDKGDPTQTASAAREMAGEGVTMMIPVITQGGASAVQPILNQSKILFISPNNLEIAEGMKEGGEYPWAFSTGPTFSQYAEGFAEYAKNVLKVKKFGELYASSPNGEFFVSSFEPSAEREGLEIVKQSFPETQSDVTAQLGQLKSEGAEAVGIWAYGTPQINVFKSFAKLGWKVPIVSDLGTAEPAVLESLKEVSPELLEEVVVGPIAKSLTVSKNGAPSEDALARAFAEKLKAVTGAPLNGNSVISEYEFDSVVALDRGIKGAGSTEPEAIAKYFSTTPVEIAQGKTVWPEERGGAVGNSEIGLMKANSDFANGTGLAVPTE